MSKTSLCFAITIFTFILLPIAQGSDDTIVSKKVFRDYAPEVKTGPNLTNHPLATWKKFNDYQLKLEIPWGEFGLDSFPLVPLICTVANKSNPKPLPIFPRLAMIWASYGKKDLDGMELSKKTKSLGHSVYEPTIYFLIEAQRETKTLMKWSGHLGGFLEESILNRVATEDDLLKKGKVMRYVSFLKYRVGEYYPTNDGRAIDGIPFSGNNEYHVTAFLLFRDRGNELGTYLQSKTLKVKIREGSKRIPEKMNSISDEIQLSLNVKEKRFRKGNRAAIDLKIVNKTPNPISLGTSYSLISVHHSKKSQAQKLLDVEARKVKDWHLSLVLNQTEPNNSSPSQLAGAARARREMGNKNLMLKKKVNFTMSLGNDDERRIDIGSNPMNFPGKYSAYVIMTPAPINTGNSWRNKIYNGAYRVQKGMAPFYLSKPVQIEILSSEEKVSDVKK